tara:strand:+ start:19981 stop:20490 length:510 start_codon:yes stop_codon:yes gene_type:complete
VLILVTGLTGAGKTTYCREFSKKQISKRYSIDDWMKALYWQDMPKEPDMNWFIENQKWYTDRIQRCEDLITKEIVELMQSEITILLDLGFTSVEHRKKYIELAQREDCEVEIHYIDVPRDVRWERVQKRNTEKAETYSMIVTKEMFDYIEEIFEDFAVDEKAIIKIIKS